MLRTITFKDKYDSTDLLKYFMMLSMYRNINNNYPNNKIYNVFHHSQCTRGNHLNLICPQARTRLYTFSIHCVGPKVWNTLPYDIKSCSYFYTFKSRVKKYLFNNLSQGPKFFL